MAEASNLDKTDAQRAAKDELNEIESLADLEGHYYRQGYREGTTIGHEKGVSEGITLGYSKGFALAMEIGFYLGTIDMLSGLTVEGKTIPITSSIDAIDSVEHKSIELFSERTRKILDQLRKSALLLNKQGVLKVEVMEQLHNIRSKFKLLSSQLGLKLKFGGSTIDKVAEAQLPAGMPSVEF